MADKNDQRDLTERRVTRLRMTNLGKTGRGMVHCILPEGTHIYRVDKDFGTWGLYRTWVIELPEEILYKMVLDGVPEAGEE